MQDLPGLPIVCVHPWGGCVIHNLACQKQHAPVVYDLVEARGSGPATSGWASPEDVHVLDVHPNISR